MFKEIDTDNSGGLSWEELHEALDVPKGTKIKPKRSPSTVRDDYWEYEEEQDDFYDDPTLGLQRLWNEPPDMKGLRQRPGYNPVGKARMHSGFDIAVERAKEAPIWHIPLPSHTALPTLCLGRPR